MCFFYFFFTTTVIKLATNNKIQTRTHTDKLTTKDTTEHTLTNSQPKIPITKMVFENLVVPHEEDSDDDDESGYELNEVYAEYNRLEAERSDLKWSTVAPDAVKILFNDAKTRVWKDARHEICFLQERLRGKLEQNMEATTVLGRDPFDMVEEIFFGTGSSVANLIMAKLSISHHDLMKFMATCTLASSLGVSTSALFDE